MRWRGIVAILATVGLMVGPAFAHGFLSSVAGARTECTITGTAADDDLNGTTKDDVICARAGSDAVNALEGNDVIKGGQGDDGTGQAPCQFGTISRGPSCTTGPIQRGTYRVPTFFGLNGNEGSDVVKGQGDDDSIEGNGESDKLVGGPGDDCLGARCTFDSTNNEPGNDTLKSRDNVSGNDYVDGGDNTDTCIVDAGDEVHNCE